MPAGILHRPDALLGLPGIPPGDLLTCAKPHAICRHQLAKEWIDDLQHIKELNSLLLNEVLMGSFAQDAEVPGG